MTLALALGAALIVLAALPSLPPDPLLPLIKGIDPRRKALERERRVGFPGLVDALGSALSSGLSLRQAFAEIAPALPRSLGRPTGGVAASLALGVRIEQALLAYRGALPDEDVAPVAIVLGSFARSGGRISRSLARVAVLLRGRLALEQEQAALTAQGRVSALVLLLLGPLGALLFALAMPSYLPTMLGSGRGLLVVAIVLEVVAAVWLRRLLRLRATGSALASLLDAMVVGLEAGLTYEQALRSVVDRAPAVGRLPETRRLLADLALGQGVPRSFAAFGTAGADEARVGALISASTRFGAPLADLLVVQADSLRETDRRRAEAAARRLPVLMLFPLTFCVLPALLIVFLGPPLLSLVE